MSRERDVVYVNTPGTTLDSAAVKSTSDFSDIEISDEEREGRAAIEAFMSLPEAERKARRADVLDRGVMFDRLAVDLPSDLHGEWERNDPMSIENKRSLGFWVDNTYATRRALHSDGSSANIVGDAIYMVTTKENKNLIDAVQRERTIREQRDPRKAPEEVPNGVPSEIPTFSESKVHEVTADDLRDTVARSTKQTAIQR